MAPEHESDKFWMFAFGSSLRCVQLAEVRSSVCLLFAVDSRSACGITMHHGGQQQAMRHQSVIAGCGY